jgi:acetyltransferase
MGADRDGGGHSPDRSRAGESERADLFDPSNDPLAVPRSALDTFFAPRTVAVVGATDKPDSVGRTVMRNLIGGAFSGAVFPVNPRRASVLGVKAYPSLAAVPDEIDLAVVVTPAPTVPEVMSACADKGVRAAIVISAGFKEAGAPGVELERRVLAEVRRGGMRLIGPNCLGVMVPRTGLNATFAATIARPGEVAFMSQSGALCTAVLDWSLRENVGFSAFASIGSMLDVSWGDLIDHLGSDPHTRSIVLYMETVGDARSFLSAAREVAVNKPIIVIKPGRTEGAARAAASHTGSLTGSDEVLDAAFRRAGVLRVSSIAELFYMAEALAKQPRPQGPRLTILTNAGGPGVLATDALLLAGGTLATLAPETLRALDAVLPAHWSHGNPIDVLGDASADRYASALEIAAADPGSDGLLVVLTPQAMTDATRTAEALRPYAHLAGKPVLASWMGGLDVAAGETILNGIGVPTFPYPDTAAQVFQHMWRYTDNLRALYETPTLPARADRPGREAADAMILRARRAGRTLLSEAESKALLAAYGIPTVATRIARSEQEAVAAAEGLGFPVVVKLHSETITHKSDVGGVKLDLRDRSAVADAYRTIAGAVGRDDFLGVTVQPMVRREGHELELIVGSSVDPQFGPVLLFGAGGTLVEVNKDRALGLPPLTSTLARRMIERTRIARALAGIRGQPPVDQAALEQMLVTFSQMIVEQPAIREAEINPLQASAAGLLALDARVVLHPPEINDEQLPRPVIRPYPTEYVSPWTGSKGLSLVIRPIRAEDEPLLVRFHETLSERTVYMRYLGDLRLDRRIAHQRLARLCFIDYSREMALVADRGGEDITAVARLIRTGSGQGEFALLVADVHQGQGLGTELLQRLIQIGRAEGLRQIVGEISSRNKPMQAICGKLGFQLRGAPSDPTVQAAITL